MIEKIKRIHEIQEINPGMQCILIDFKPFDIGIIRSLNCIGCNIGALFNGVIVTPFYRRLRSVISPRLEYPESD